MCAYSMVVDHFYEKWKDRQPPYKIIPGDWDYHPYIPILYNPPVIYKEEIEDFEKFLERAREYDKKNSRPDCELQEKKDRLLKLAEELGVKIDFL